MEVFLKTNIDQWLIIRCGYTSPVNNPEEWTEEIKKKVQIDSKALNTLQCGLSKEELKRVGPFENAKEL